MFKYYNISYPMQSLLAFIFECLFPRQRQPKLQARDAGIWWGTLGKLQLMLRKAAKALYQVKVVFNRRHFCL